MNDGWRDILHRGDRKMTTPLESLVASGTKLWLDSVDPDEVEKNLAWGATGATSNPIIIADLVGTGRFDGEMKRFLRETEDNDQLAWKITDLLVRIGEFVTERLILIFSVSWCRQSLLKPERSCLRQMLVHKAVAQHVAALKKTGSSIAWFY